MTKRERWAGMGAAHRDGCPGKQGALLAQGEGSDAIRLSKEKQNFLCGQTCFAQFVGSQFWVIKKPFVNKVFSSHFLCNGTRLPPCCNCTQVSAPNPGICSWIVEPRPLCQPRTSVQSPMLYKRTSIPLVTSTNSSTV